MLHLASDSPAPVRRRAGLRYAGRHRARPAGQLPPPAARPAAVIEAAPAKWPPAVIGTAPASLAADAAADRGRRRVRIAFAAATGLAALVILVPAAPVAADLLGASKHPAAASHPAGDRHRAPATAHHLAAAQPVAARPATASHQTSVNHQTTANHQAVSRRHHPARHRSRRQHQLGT